jgi:THO complex subunit 2
MSVNLAEHHRSFISLLSFSPWSELHRGSLVEVDRTTVPPAEQYQGKTLDQVLLSAEEASMTQQDIYSSQASNSPRVLAQVLGFKFAYYQVGFLLLTTTSRRLLISSVQSPNVLEPTPRHLYLTAAILIRQGFLALEDLCPHVSAYQNSMFCS